MKGEEEEEADMDLMARSRVDDEKEEEEEEEAEEDSAARVLLHFPIALMRAHRSTLCFTNPIRIHPLLTSFHCTNLSSAAAAAA